MSQLTIQMLFVAIIIGIAAGSSVYAFVRMTKEQKIKNIKEWLKWAVIEAERQLGSGTGQLKLRLVYNSAVNKFPFIVSLVSFEVFSLWVDDALEWMKKQLETNEAISQYVNK